VIGFIAHRYQCLAQHQQQQQQQASLMGDSVTASTVGVVASGQ